MKYIEEIGIAYDTIYYGVIYFNQDIVLNGFKEFNAENEVILLYYNEIRTNNSIPSSLYPFFYYDGNYPCFLSYLLFEYMDFFKNNIDDFINLLKDKKVLIKEVFCYFLQNLSGSQIEELINGDNIRLIDKTFHEKYWPPELQSEIIFLFYNFDYVSDILIEIIHKTSKDIIALHKKYISLIDEKIKETEEQDNIIFCHKVFSIGKEKIENQFFTLSFMNLFIAAAKQSENGEVIFIFGTDHKETLKFNISKDKILLKKALESLGDSVKFDIINCLMQHRSLTSKELGNRISLSNSTIFRHTTKLIEAGIIENSKPKRGKTTFAINKYFIKELQKEIDNFTSKIRYENGERNSDKQKNKMEKTTDDYT